MLSHVFSKFQNDPKPYRNWIYQINDKKIKIYSSHRDPNITIFIIQLNYTLFHKQIPRIKNTLEHDLNIFKSLKDKCINTRRNDPLSCHQISSFNFFIILYYYYYYYINSLLYINPNQRELDNLWYNPQNNITWGQRSTRAR